MAVYVVCIYRSPVNNVETQGHFSRESPEKAGLGVRRIR